MTVQREVRDQLRKLRVLLAQLPEFAQLANALGHQADEEIIAGKEIEIDGADDDFGLARDHLDRRAVDACLAKTCAAAARIVSRRARRSRSLRSRTLMLFAESSFSF